MCEAMKQRGNGREYQRLRFSVASPFEGCSTRREAPPVGRKPGGDNPLICGRKRGVFPVYQNVSSVALLDLMHEFTLRNVDFADDFGKRAVSQPE